MADHGGSFRQLGDCSCAGVSQIAMDSDSSIAASPVKTELCD